MENNSCIILRDEVTASRSSYTTTTHETVDKPWPKPQLQKVACPRCNSSNTRFCYYNNKNMAQPRQYFCKSCRHYWTDGGSLRDVPMGGGGRKNKHMHNPMAMESNIGFELPRNNLSLRFGMPTSSSDLVVPSVPQGGLLSSNHERNNNNYYGLIGCRGMAMAPPTTFGIASVVKNVGLGATGHAMGCASATHEFQNQNGGISTMGAMETGDDDMRTVMAELQWSPQLGAEPVGCPQQQAGTVDTMVMGASSNTMNNSEYYGKNGVLSNSTTETFADPWQDLIKDFSEWEEKYL